MSPPVVPPFTPGQPVPIADCVNPARWRDRFAWGHILSRAFAVHPDINESELNTLRQETFGYLPDHVVEWHLGAALSELGARLQTRLRVEVVKAPPVDSALTLGSDYHRVGRPLPYVRDMARTHLRIDVGEPLLSVQRVRAQYSGSEPSDFVLPGDVTASVKIVDPATGVFHIIPSGGLFGFPALNDGAAPLPIARRYQDWGWNHSSRSSTAPAVWLVDYTTGPVGEAGYPGGIDALLANWVYARAGLMMFSLSGVAQAGGVSSTSLSIDGVSRSTSLTASAIYGLNSSFEKVLEDYGKAIDWNYWRSRYSGVHVGMF